MNKISVIIIARDSADFIGKCLESVKFADEIIVIDTGSVDNTRDIAKKQGALVEVVKPTDFSSLRDHGLRKAKNEWILYVDTDEVVTEELETEIKSVLSTQYNFAAYRIKRKNFYFGNFAWPYVENLERLFNKKKLKGWFGKLHESPEIEGQVGDLKGLLLHYTHKDLQSMVEKTNEWSEVEAKLRFDQNHPKMSWWRFFRVMLTAFVNSYFKQSGWKTGIVGVVESMYQSFSMFITYSKLWELQQLQEIKK